MLPNSFQHATMIHKEKIRTDVLPLNSYRFNNACLYIGTQELITKTRVGRSQ